MRLLFVHNIPPWDRRAGGGQRIHHEIARALHRRGHDVRALFLGGASQPPEPVEYGFHWVPEHPRLLNNVRAMTRATEALLERWIPDGAYLSAAEGMGVCWALPGRTGVVMTSHHPDLPSLRPGDGGRAPWTRLARLRRLQRFHLERALLRGAHRRTATSQFGRRMLVERGYLDGSNQVTVIPNGVDPAWFVDEPGKMDRAGFLFVGRLDTQKGVDVLLEAFATAGTDWTLRVIGDGWARDAYEDRARTLSLSHRVSFQGHGSTDQVRLAMARAGALIAPSRAENYPIVLLEAMAGGLPVVATAVGGIPEMIEHGRSGLLVPPEDPEALRGAMEQVAGSASLRASLAAGGREVAARHRWDRITEALARELERAVALARAESPASRQGSSSRGAPPSARGRTV